MIFTGVVLRPIQLGDQLMTNRLGIVPEHRTDVPKLLAHIGAVCHCDRCESPDNDDDSIPENKYLQWDPDFVKINVNKNHQYVDYDEKEAKELETICVSLLKKYGVSGAKKLILLAVFIVFRWCIGICFSIRRFIIYFGSNFDI